jgi:hypothetical protein
MSPGIRDGHCICGEIRAPRSITSIGQGLFLCSGPHPYQEEQMDNREIAFTKQAALATRDWDTYQAILRKCLRVPESMVKTREKACKL